MDMMKKIGFDSAYIFKYSPRPPAKSAAMVDDVPEDVKEEAPRRTFGGAKKYFKEKSKDTTFPWQLYSYWCSWRQRPFTRGRACLKEALPRRTG